MLTHPDTVHNDAGQNRTYTKDLHVWNLWGVPRELMKPSRHLDVAGQTDEQELDRFQRYHQPIKWQAQNMTPKQGPGRRKNDFQKR